MKNPIYVALLRDARKHLARTVTEYRQEDRPRYICLALQSIAFDPRNRSDARIAAYDGLRALIEKRLGVTKEGCLPNFEQWLMARGYIKSTRDLIDRPREFKKVQATRLRWIDSLIEEFSK